MQQRATLHRRNVRRERERGKRKDPPEKAEKGRETGEKVRERRTGQMIDEKRIEGKSEQCVRSPSPSEPRCEFLVMLDAGHVTLVVRVLCRRHHRLDAPFRR